MTRRADRRMLGIADDLIDGRVPDWSEARAAAHSAGQRRRLGTLGLLAALAPSPQTDDASTSPRPSIWLWVLVAVAAARAAAAIATGAADAFLGGGLMPARQALLISVFGGVSAVVLAAGRHDQRAVSLGTLFLLVAAAFSGRLSPVPLAVESWLPYAAWRFASVFPTAGVSRGTMRVLRTGIVVALIAGCLLATASWIAQAPGRGGQFFLLFDRYDAAGSYYWTVLFAVLLPALPLMLVRARWASSDERYRFHLFTCALVAGLSPVVIAVLLETPGSGLAPYLSDQRASAFVQAIVDVGLLSVPFTAAYAIFVHKILKLQFVVRRTVQYALARHTLMVLAVAPLLALAYSVYLARSEPIASLASRVSLRTLLVVSGLAGLGLYTRERTLTWLADRFGRAPVDFPAVIQQFTDLSRQLDTPASVATLFRRSVTGIVRPESSALLVLGPGRSAYEPLEGEAPPLDASSTMVRLASRGTIVPLSTHEAASAVRWLPSAEQQWAASSRAAWLVPIVGRAHLPLGLLVLGERQSHQSLTPGEQALLGALASAAAAKIEQTLEGERRDGGGEDERWTWTSDAPGGSCARCGLVAPLTVATCSCGGAMEPMQAPVRLAGKFVIERRVGQGAMGIVFRATDTSLGRPVAIKTLPRTSAEHRERLQREARTMAALSHPNIAVIYGTEYWRGTPMLLVEYLPGGTLADRIALGPADGKAVLTLGIALADALDAAHRALILHRDIKPTNIGFAAGGVPKILDFGLAAFSDDMPLTAAVEVPRERLADVTFWATIGAAGTPLYLAPEALAGHLPQPSFDVWSLTLVLLEMLTGQHPFVDNSWVDTRENISRGRLAPGVVPPDSPLTGMLLENLQPEPSRRISSAAGLREALRSLG